MSIVGTETHEPLSRAAIRLPVLRDSGAMLRWGSIIFLLIAGEIGGRYAAGTGLIAPPSLVVRALVTEILPDAQIRAALVSALVEIVIAYALAVGGGLMIGIAVGWTRFSRTSLFPIVMLFYAVPQVVLLPLLTLGFGIGPAAKIAFGCSHGIFPVIVNTVAGMRNVNPLYVSAVRCMGGSSGDVARNVMLPHMTGSLFAGLRMSMTMTLLGVILAELYVSTGGIGYFTRQFANTFDPAPLYALIFALAMIAITMNGVVRQFERRFTRWKG